jgi:Tol biopolymer transport system component
MPAHRSLTRIVLAGLFAAAGSLALGCGGEDPLAPAEAADPLAPTAEVAPAPAGAELTALTGKRIAFISYRYNNWPNVYTMDPAGTNVTRVTGWSTYVRSPAWSPDNQRIAMGRERLDATNTPHEDIYVMNADGSNKHWARSAPSSFPISFPSWSPDGKNLVVTVYVGGGWFIAKLTLATGALDFVSLAAGGPVGSEPSYDPTGKKIVYLGKNGMSIERINADGSGLTTILSSATSHFGSPRYSPDGTRILFSKTVNQDTEIFVKNANGTVQRLTTSPGDDGQATWSSDGSKIVFSSHRSGQDQLWTMSSTGGAATRITHSSNLDVDPVYMH